MRPNMIDPLLYKEKAIPNILMRKPSKTPEKVLTENKSQFEKALLNSALLNKTPTRKAVLKDIGNDEQKKKLYQAAIQFEAFFVEKMFKEMKKNVGKSSLINGGYAEEIFGDMLLSERTKVVANNVQFGLAEKMYSQLQRFY